MAKKLAKAQFGKIVKGATKTVIKATKPAAKETYGNSRWTTWDRALKEKPEKVYPTLKPEVTKDGKLIVKPSGDRYKKGGATKAKKK
jgi:hypothetical protein